MQEGTLVYPGMPVRHFRMRSPPCCTYYTQVVDSCKCAEKGLPDPPLKSVELLIRQRGGIDKDGKGVMNSILLVRLVVASLAKV